MSSATCVSQTPSLTPYFQNANITLYHSKYEEVLPLLKSNSFDSIISDPPYANTDIEWDKPIDWKFFWKETGRITKNKSPIVLFASGKFVYELQNTNPKFFRYDLIWEKNLAVGFLDANRRPLRSHENILIFTNTLFRGSTYNAQMVEGKKHTVENKLRKIAHYGGYKKAVSKRETNLYHPKSILKFNNSRNKSLHPTQKPLDLMDWLIRTYSNRFETILEPFAGSGSTVIAAARNGRRCVAIEQSEEYCEIIARRINVGE